MHRNIRQILIFSPITSIYNGADNGNVKALDATEYQGLSEATEKDLEQKPELIPEQLIIKPPNHGSSCRDPSDSDSVDSDLPRSNVDADVEGSDPEGSRIDIYSNISNMITLLYRILIAIRPARRQAHSQEYSELDLNHWKHYDFRHVEDKFPSAVSKHHFLLVRLSRANTERRKFFQYQQVHREKLARAPEYSEDHPVPEGTVLTKLSSLQDLPPTPVPGHMDAEVNSDGGCTQTSYAPTSVLGKDTGLPNLSVPHPPNAARAYCDEPFECPYCRYPIIVSNFRSWQ